MIVNSKLASVGHGGGNYFLRWFVNWQAEAGPVRKIGPQLKELLGLGIDEN